MKRRDFMTLLGGAAAGWPVAVRAQQAAMPIMGFLRPGSPQEDTNPLVAFRQGLKEIAYIEGQNLTIEYRWAGGQYDKLRALAVELVRRQVALIFAGSSPAAVAAKAATSTIPIVFTSGADPVALGLVASLNRPGGNVTGVSFFINSLGPKRLELLAELLPNARRLATLINPTLPDAESQLSEARDAASRLGRELIVLRPRNQSEIETAFTTLSTDRVGAVDITLTGFTQYEPSMVGKWLGALKEIAPTTDRVAIVVNPETAPLRGTFYLREFETAAATLGVKPATNFVHSEADIEAAMASLGQAPHSAVIVAPETFTTAHRKLFIALAERKRVPAIYGLRQFAATGGLMSYGPDTVDMVRRAAGYIDRILRGEKPADLPVQAPTKYELIINLKTAGALGLDVPATLLARADEVIE